ncbi:MAG: hypothetical protein AAFU85_12385 [Planctomycetota bacterium]
MFDKSGLLTAPAIGITLFAAFVGLLVGIPFGVCHSLVNWAGPNRNDPDDASPINLRRREPTFGGSFKKAD